jgi:hypothetical protein
VTTRWLTALGTVFGPLLLAAVAIWQDSFRGWFFHPTLEASIRSEPPDSISIPFTRLNGEFVSNAFFFRILVKNTGNLPAKNVEVYASELLRQRRADNTWEIVKEFPPMNLPWTSVGRVFPSITPNASRYCDLGHIADPAHRRELNEENASLHLTDQQTALVFSVIAPPNNKGHIVGPGNYRLEIQITADNAQHPLDTTVSINVTGNWYADEATMFRDGVSVTIP